jgi:hypothetical protein
LGAVIPELDAFGVVDGHAAQYQSVEEVKLMVKGIK